MKLFRGAIEIKWHGTFRQRVKRVLREQGYVAAIRYVRLSKPEEQRNLKSEVDYVKTLRGDLG